MLNSYCVNVIFHLSPQFSGHIELLQVKRILSLHVKTIEMFQLLRVDQRLDEALIVTTHLITELLLTFANSTGPHDPTESKCYAQDGKLCILYAHIHTHRTTTT